ncbi:LytR family transcriptional attenuator [Herbinix hemicellulosilytica]|uniref:Cell envelope-related transcriptional attenuator domain-containing protein n=1 Tax=Herbinix hemicellulosilytica TaxID=1564487 RepID=A0A0H5SG51_HERHM|nr:LCP family protein [Herbinix hemicellulosilytica]RBP60757.1 LytR family transcriptional attenuator [Herbinix hemicellulosilytica]CRZ34444.1 hypothetical protein HHT355_1242 [Herbinix hemicellulosilytica]
MKKTLRKLKVKKAVLVSLGTGFAFFVTVFFIGYMVIRNYIRKMNVIDRSQEDDYVYAEDYNDNIDIDENVHMIENQVSEAFQDELSIDDINVDNVSDSTDEDLNFLSEYEKIADIPVMKDKNVFNVLLIGSDSRDPDDRGRSDAMMVLSVSKKNKEIVLTSLLRDIYLNIPGKKSNRLNAAYALGGAKLLTETIENNFKIKLDGYVAVDFIAFLEIIDILGGVTVEVTEEELPFLNSNIRNINMFLNEDTDKDLIPAAGKYLLNGKQTLGYSRIRYAGTDFARTARQRKVLEQIFEKMKNIGLLDILNILNKVLPKVTTNLSEKEIISHIINLPDYFRYEFKQWRIPVDGSYKYAKIKGKDVLIIDIEKNINEILKKIYTIKRQN